MDDGRSDERDAGVLDLTQGALAVARLGVDRPGRLGDDFGVESLAHGVERGLLDAVVRREPGDDDVLHAAILQYLLEVGVAPLAGRQVRDAEPRITVFGSRRLVDDLAGDLQVGRKLRPPRVVDTVHRPSTAVLRKVRGLCRVPDLGVDDRDAGGPRAVDLAVDDRHDFLAALDVEAALRVGEVVLHVDDEERRAGAVLDCAQREPPRSEGVSRRRVSPSVESNAMAYQSLYRKHRPQTFGGLAGQDHVTGALRNAVREGRVGHAYLFSGPRGTGKTTTARILAKALNCDAPVDGEPC